MSQDNVADALNTMMNAKRAGKSVVELKHSSKLLTAILAIAKLKGYVKEYKLENNTLKVTLSKSLNGCGAIKPRFAVKVGDIEKYNLRYLPAKNIGILIISTSQGLITHQTAIEKNLGGSLIAYLF